VLFAFEKGRQAQLTKHRGRQAIPNRLALNLNRLLKMISKERGRSGEERDGSSFQHLNNKIFFPFSHIRPENIRMALSQAGGNSGNAAFKVRAY
jgi:hypothetical protein